MFEEASRKKLRFETSMGTLGVDDLWDLPLTSKTGRTNLDEIAIDLNKKLERQTVSFVEPAGPSNPLTQLRFDIVTHIIKVRVEEKKAADTARDKAAEKQKLLEILARKQDQKLEAASEEEIRKMIEAL